METLTQTKDEEQSTEELRQVLVEQAIAYLKLFAIDISKYNIDAGVHGSLRRAYVAFAHKETDAKIQLIDIKYDQDGKIEYFEPIMYGVRIKG